MFTLSHTPLIKEDEIASRIADLARMIADDLRRYGPITAVPMLRGCFVFAADLLRALSREGVEIDEVCFLTASSYGSGTTSSGTIKVLQSITTDLKDRNILLLDDIIDTGRTLKHIKELLGDMQPSRIMTCTLLDKPSRREVEFEPDYVGFSINDVFVVGYGLDFDQKYRALPYIGIIEEQIA